jgi:hypothetical protein
MMTNDKDSAVLADKSDEYAIGHLSALLEVELHENGHTIGEDLAEKLAEIAVKTVRQPTQSDALLEGDTQTILYLLGVKHGQEDERAKIAAEASQPTQSDEEAYYLGKRDGYETAVQDIDMLTGGDGEYCYSTIEGERHCPNVDTMKARIARRLRQPTQSDALREENERLRALLARTVNLAEVYAEGTGTNFKEAMAEARAALQGQSK